MLSADGNILAVGGYKDNYYTGATWIFERGIEWVQKTKLIGSESGGLRGLIQGTSVSLSANGTTLAIGGYSDDYYVRAIWIFERAVSGEWAQKAKTVESGYMHDSSQGVSVALPADGNTLAAGGCTDNFVLEQSGFSIET